MTRTPIILLTLAFAMAGCSSPPEPSAHNAKTDDPRLFPLTGGSYGRPQIIPGTWTTFADDLLSLDYPKGEGFTLVVQNPGDTFPFENRPVTTAKDSFFRIYRLAKGEKTWFLLRITKDAQFDDNTCFCGAIVFDQYALRNGSLFRFSYLEHGAVKTVQVLNNAYHADSFEWTHLPIAQEDYFRIAQSIRFRVPEKDPAARRAALIAQYGIKAKLGLLEKGMSRDDILGLAGPPDAATPDTLTYIREDPHHRWRTITTIPLRQGRFEGFTADSLRSERIPAERGSIDWIRESLEKSSPFASEKDEPPLPAADIRLMFDRFVELAPAANANDWSSLCSAMNSLSERGHTDPRVLPLIRQRFCDLTLDASQAGDYLGKHDRRGSLPLFSERAESLMRKAKPSRFSNDDPFDNPGYELKELISLMPEASPERLHTIRAALVHLNAQIRTIGMNHLDELPEAETDIFVRQYTNRAAELMSRAQTGQPANATEDSAYELRALISAIPATSPSRLGTIRQAIRHSDAVFRAAGLMRHDELPPEEAYTELRQALSDKALDARAIAAYAFAETTGTADDLPLLRARLKAESEPSIQAALTKAIARLEAENAPTLRDTARDR